LTAIRTTYSGDLRTEATHTESGTKVITDAPKDNHGMGESFSPSELFLASLSSCMLSCMGIASKKHRINIDGATCEAHKAMLSNPRRIDEVFISFKFPLLYTPKEQKILEAAAYSCPISLSLHPDLKKSVNFNW